jgi:predicted kinase
MNGEHLHERELLGAPDERDDVVFVLATGHEATRAAFTSELARRLGAAHLAASAVERALLGLPREARRQAAASVLAALADVQIQGGISVVVDANLDLEIEAELNRVRRNHPDVPVVRIQALEGQSLQPSRLATDVVARARRNRAPSS